MKRRESSDIIPPKEALTELYYIQSNDNNSGILDTNLVEKIVLGVESDENSKPGQILAAYTFASFAYPNENVSCAELTTSGGDYYNSALTSDINDIDHFENCVNATTNGEYDLTFHALLSPGAALFMIYELILLCIDTALRTIKLGLLQLIAPVVLCGYVVVGSEILVNWFKEVGKTFVLIFIKIAAMSFMVYGLSMLPGFISNLPSGGIWYTGFIRLFIIIGLFQVIHHAPDIINAVFGTHIQSRGGIRGRLGEMAAVGNLAQRGWDQLRTHPVQTTRRLASAPLSMVGSAASHLHAVRNRANGVRQRVMNETDNVGLAHASAALSALGGILGTGGAMLRGGQRGFQNGNLRGIGEQGHRYTDTHPVDSTLRGRIDDRIRADLGLRSREDQELEAMKRVTVRINGQDRTISIDELKGRQQLTSQIVQSNGEIQSQIEAELNDEGNAHAFNIHDNNGHFQINAQNANEARRIINSLNNNKHVNADGSITTQDLFGNRITLSQEDFAESMSALQHNFETDFIDARNNLHEQIMANGSAAGILTGARMAEANRQIGHISDIITNNDDIRQTFEDGQGGVQLQFNADGNAMFQLGQFRDHAMMNMYDQNDRYGRALNEYNDNVTGFITSDMGRNLHNEAEANRQVDSYNNGQGGNNNGGGHN